MAKITRRHGASFEEVPVKIRRAELGGEQSSVGNNSSASTKQPQKTGDSENPSRLSPARTTDSPSSVPEKATGSDAPLTDTGGQKKTQPRSVRRAAKKVAPAKKVQPGKQARVRSTDDLLD